MKEDTHRNYRLHVEMQNVLILIFFNTSAPVSLKPRPPLYPVCCDWSAHTRLTLSSCVDSDMSENTNTLTDRITARLSPSAHSVSEKS